MAGSLGFHVEGARCMGAGFGGAASLEEAEEEEEAEAEAVAEEEAAAAAGFDGGGGGAGTGASPSSSVVDTSLESSSLDTSGLVVVALGAGSRAGAGIC